VSDIGGVNPHEKQAFDRVLGLPQVTMSGVDVIIRAGIFVLLGPATQEAGGAVWLSFVVAALLSALTAFSYMELASMFPKASSEHEFTRHVFPRWVSAVVGWSMAAALVVARELERDSLWMVGVVLVVGLGAHLVFRRPRPAA